MSPSDFHFLKPCAHTLIFEKLEIKKGGKMSTCLIQQTSEKCMPGSKVGTFKKVILRGQTGNNTPMLTIMITP